MVHLVPRGVDRRATNTLHVSHVFFEMRLLEMESIPEVRMRRRRSSYAMQAVYAAVLAVALLSANRTAQAQDIKPISALLVASDGESGPNPSSSPTTTFVDLSGLMQLFHTPGRQQHGFQRDESWTLQLTEDLPVWTVYNTQSNGNNNNNFFTFSSADERISVRMIQYQLAHQNQTSRSSSSSMILRGVVEDRDTNIVWDLKPDYGGRDTVTPMREKDFPPYGEIPPSIQLIRKAISFAKAPIQTTRNWFSPPQDQQQQYTPELLAEMARQMVHLDLMVIWTEAAECKKSQVAAGCTLDEVTRANMEADVALWVAETNLAHRNSGTGVAFAVVHQQRDAGGYSECGKTSCQIKTDVKSHCQPELGYVHDLRCVMILIISTVPLCCHCIEQTKANQKRLPSSFMNPFFSPTSMLIPLCIETTTRLIWSV